MQSPENELLIQVESSLPEILNLIHISISYQGDKNPLDIATRLNAEGINIVIDLGGPLSVKSQIALAMQPSPIAVNYLSWLSTQAAPQP